MKEILLVGLGGFLGSIARYKAGGIVLHAAQPSDFPYGTLAVNIAGCILIGLLAGTAERFGIFGESSRLLIFTGLLGGFTTFSAFSLDAVFLLRKGELMLAALYVGASVLAGIFATWLALRSFSFIPR